MAPQQPGKQPDIRTPPPSKTPEILAFPPYFRFRPSMDRNADITR